MSADLLARLRAHIMEGGDPRGLLEELARSGPPAEGEELARRLVFEHLEYVQDHLPPADVARLEAMLEPATGPLATAVPSDALDQRVLAAVEREVRPAVRPEVPLDPPRPPPANRAWLTYGFAAVVASAIALAAVKGRAPGPDAQLPPAVESSEIAIRLDRARYHTGDTVFIQLAPARAGHLSLLVSTAAGKPGVALAEQPVAAGQVVVAHLQVNATSGTAQLVAVLSDDRLAGLAARIDRLPPPAAVSTLIEATEALARRQGARVWIATAAVPVEH